MKSWRRPLRLLAKPPCQPQSPFMHLSHSPANEDLWVFGIRFAHVAAGFPAILNASGTAHRAAPGVVCVFLRNRGTPESPPRARPRPRRRLSRHRLSGGSGDRGPTIAYLREREQVPPFTLKPLVALRLNGAPRDVTALVFLGRPQPSAVLPDALILSIRPSGGNGNGDPGRTWITFCPRLRKSGAGLPRRRLACDCGAA